MTSYKTLYQEQVKFDNTQYLTDYCCPKCNSRVLLQGQEFICENVDCSFDLEVLELFSRYAEQNNYEKFD